MHFSLNHGELRTSFSFWGITISCCKAFISQNDIFKDYITASVIFCKEGALESACLALAALSVSSTAVGPDPESAEACESIRRSKD